MKSFSLFVVFLTVLTLSVDDHAWAMGKKTRSSSTRSGLWSNSNSQSSSDAQLGGSQEVVLSFNDGVDFDNELASLRSDFTEAPQSFKPDVSPAANGVSSLENKETTPGNEAFPSTTTVPEPATLTLMGLGMAGLMLGRHKR